jgi:hypothetical protein
VNEPLTFINFVAAFAVGSTIEGEVVSFTSHGAMVDVALPGGGEMHCYIPLTAMGTPPPTKARQVLKKGEVRPFVLAGLDPPRRVAELTLSTGAGTAATPPVAAKKAPSENRPAPTGKPSPPAKKAAAKKAAAKKAAAEKSAAKKPPSKKAATKKTGAKKAGAKKAAAKKAGAPAKKAGKKAAAAATKAAKKAPAKKEAKKAPATKAAAKKVAGAGPKKAPAKKAGKARVP